MASLTRLVRVDGVPEDAFPVGTEMASPVGRSPKRRDSTSTTEASPQGRQQTFGAGPWIPRIYG